MKISITIPTYLHGPKLNCLLESLLGQHNVTGTEWEAQVLHDGPPNVSFIQTQGFYQQYPQLTFKHTPYRFNVWGHDLTQTGLSMSTGDYWMRMNGDNQYCYGWLERVLPILTREQPDILTWSCVHSYTEFSEFIPELIPGKIDFCNYLLKTDKAKQLGFPWRHFEADGAQIEEFVKLYPNLKHIQMPNVLTIHN